MELRDYQLRAKESVFRELTQKDATIVVMATGCGKTVVFTHIGKEFGQLTQKKVLVLVHRDELIRQSANKIEKIAGISPEIEKAKEKTNFTLLDNNGWVVASVQTMIAGKGDWRRMHKFDASEFGLVIVDESHHSVSKSWKHVIDHFREAGCKVLGVTATPDRTDMESLGQIYESVAYEYDIADAINDGYLVPIISKPVSAHVIDISDVRTTAGDLNNQDRAKKMEEGAAIAAICVPTLEYTLGLPRGHLANGKPIIDPTQIKKTLIFASSVFHADLICAYINNILPGQAVSVSGKTPKQERKRILEDYKSGKFMYLANFGVFTEGFDEPSIQVIIMARPTKSRSLYAQMLGRGTRTLEGLIDGISDSEKRRELIANSQKPCVTVLDFVFNCGKHSIVRATDALAGNVTPEIQELAARISVERGEADVMKVLEEAKAKEEEKLRKAKEKEEREQEAMRKWNAQVEYQIQNVEDCLGVSGLASKRFGSEKISEKQVEFLRKHKVDKLIDITKLSKGQADKITRGIFRRMSQGLCSLAQAKILKEHGYHTDYTRQEASDIIGKLFLNRGKGVDMMGLKQKLQTVGEI